MDKFKVLAITLAVSSSTVSHAVHADGLRVGVMRSNVNLDLDAADASSSDNNLAFVFFMEKDISPRLAIHADYKHINNDCESVCADSTKFTQSVELSARFSQPLSDWLEVYERAGANYYSVKTYSSWHLAHSSKTESGVGPSVAAGFAVSPAEKIRVGLEYDVSFLKSSQKAAFTSIFISMIY